MTSRSQPVCPKVIHLPWFEVVSFPIPSFGQAESVKTPRGLAPDRDASDVAEATGKSVLLILRPKSKGNAVTLGWTDDFDVEQYKQFWTKK